MPPPTPQPTIATGGAPQALDPTIVNLAKAIRTTETKGAKDPFTAKGASGEYGAYQYTDATWNADAKKYLGTAVPLTSATKEQQNEVAYKKLSDLKAAGNNVGQIASIWNSGSPKWEGKVGVNKSGVKYDVPQYVDSVAKAYQSFKAGQDPTNSPTSSTVGNEKIVTPQQQADQSSAQQSGAFFPAVTGDSPLSAGLKTAGNLIPSAINFAKGALNTINPVNIAKTLGAIPGAFSGLVQDAGGVGNAIKVAGSEILPTAYKTLVPEAGRDLIAGDTAGAQRAITNDPIGQIAPFVFGAKGLAEGVDSATATAAKANMADYVKNIQENTAKGEPIPTRTGTAFGPAVDAGVSKAASVVTKPLAYAFGKASDAVVGPKVPSTEMAANTAGKVLQGDTGEAALGAKVLGGIDTSGVKTYEDLSGVLQKNIKENLAKVDTEFAASPKPVKLESLDQKITGEVGGIKVNAKANYVKTALSHLQELYQKTNDVQELANIKALIAKAKKVGLTPTEVNGIARKYGTEFGTKAFSARTGDPLTSVNARSYENVRTGVKETARALLKTDEAKSLDKNTSDMIKVKRLSDQMQEKVNKLTQRVQQRNVVEKIARGLGQVIDFATFGGPKAFIQKLFFPSNVGLKTMNSLDLEGQLSKNLRLIKSFEKGDDTTFANTVINVLKSVNNLPQARPAQVGAFAPRQATPAQ